MKMRVLTVAVLATFASGAVLAASEGGDTWSAIQSEQQSTYSASRSPSRVDPVDPVLDAAFTGSEGGDTWSSLQALRETGGQQIAQAPRAPGSLTYAGLPGGSEGGDTWSRFVPQFQSEPMGAANLASARSGAHSYWQPPFGE